MEEVSERRLKDVCIEVLKDRLGLVVKRCSIKRLDGISNRTYSLTVVDEQGKTRKFSIKIYEGTRRSAQKKLVKEQYVTYLLRAFGVHAPRIIHADPEGSLIGKPLMIRTWVHAKEADKLLDKVELSSKIVEVLVETLVKIHRIPLDIIDNAKLSIPKSSLDYIESQITLIRILGRILKLPVEGLVRWLKGNVPSKMRLALLHGDYSPGNVLIDKDLKSHLVDLESFEIGIPASDVCYAYHFLAIHENLNRRVRGLANIFIRHYRRYLPLTYDEFRYWRVLSAAKLLLFIKYLETSRMLLRKGPLFYPVVKMFLIRPAIKYLSRVIFTTTSIKIL